MSQIQSTKDYSVFKRITGNRTVSKSQIDRLRLSIDAHPELTKVAPIIVNDNMEVIDGQHRLEALQSLQLPVFYLQASDLKLEDVQILNSATKVWSPVDYAKSFAELGNKNYAVYLEFKKTYHLSHDILALYLSDVGKDGTDTNKFRQGKFKTGNLAAARLLCEKFSEIRPYYKRSGTRSFAYAFRKIYLHPQYDHKRMVSKVKQFNHFFGDNALVEDYLRDFEKIYNYHAPESERIRFF